MGAWPAHVRRPAPRKTRDERACAIDSPASERRRGRRDRASGQQHPSGHQPHADELRTFMRTAMEHAATENTQNRNSRRREQTRARLIEAATALFAKQGTERTRINEITELADVGFGSFYNYFESKDAIVDAVLGETAGAHATAIVTATAAV